MDTDTGPRPALVAGQTEEMTFTPTQRRLLEALQDGLGHSSKDLLGALNDTQADLNLLRVHLTLLRKRLRPRGQDVVCELRSGCAYYRWTRYVMSSND